MFERIYENLSIQFHPARFFYTSRRRGGVGEQERNQDDDLLFRSTLPRLPFASLLFRPPRLEAKPSESEKASRRLIERASSKLRARKGATCRSSRNLVLGFELELPQLLPSLSSLSLLNRQLRLFVISQPPRALRPLSLCHPRQHGSEPVRPAVSSSSSSSPPQEPEHERRSTSTSRPRSRRPPTLVELRNEAYEHLGVGNIQMDADQDDSFLPRIVGIFFAIFDPAQTGGAKVTRECRTSTAFVGGTGGEGRE
ncbi:hypothetical protein BDY24DRAFT_205820 [Mrakia frigida]|uniref:uncharacterized protein n=1 Tax=Mrakia frigida TaxID=29902 RepID=UPI003FCBF521